MADKKKCSKGHPMDPSWKICPYCGESTQAGPAETKKTVVEGGAPALKKTVREEVALEMETAQEAEKKPLDRKTKILKQKPPDIPALAWLVALDGPTKATVYQIIKEKTTVGSGVESDIQIEEEFVSSRHASFYCDKGKYFVTDLDSANGTFVNGRRVTKKGLLDGDKIKLGETNYAFKFVVF